jgi:sulfonate transport system ATP-binding protein
MGIPLGKPAAAPLVPQPAPESRGELVLQGVGKSFGGKSVLDGLDLQIPAGQFVAVVGRSGGGKTTLLRLLAGLETPDAGTIALDGTPRHGLQRDVRLMFQDARLLPWQRLLGNVGIARGPDWRERAASLLAEVGLGERANDWPYSLSGGQRQRVALARALVTEPGILLLDEPFGALDAMTRTEMHRLLIRVWQEHGFTALLITHDVAEAVALADRVLVLRDGAVAEDILIEAPRSDRSLRAAELERRILAAV